MSGRRSCNRRDATITAQITSLIEAWRWTVEDRIPLFLPLHHVHGIINVLSCCRWAGGHLEAFDRFNAPAIVDRVIAGHYTLFVAVPTIYVRLIKLMDSLPPDRRRDLAAGFAALRLSVSGSAALPASMHDRWATLTGQRLLERYGMTEIGMALSHRYDGERRAGAVGEPLPGVEVRLVDEEGREIVGEDTAGEIQVRGPTVFLEYWLRPEAVRAWCRGRLSPDRIPRIMLVVDDLPRNAMGKCDKTAVHRLFMPVAP